MKAIDFSEVKSGDTILVYDKTRSVPFIKVRVNNVDLQEHSVICSDTGLDIYPDENDQYILIDYEF
jgi:ribosomal 30S subunit maturation factor RimM